MTTQRIEVDTVNGREDWLRLRSQDVTASVVGSLFGVSPYKTAAGLYDEKLNGSLDEAYGSRDFLDWRLDLEAVFPARLARKRPEWHLEKAAVYLRDPVARIGATPDFYVTGDPRGLLILQAKTVGVSEFKKKWADGPPAWIVLQNATELMLEPNAVAGVIACITVSDYGSETHIFDVPRNISAENAIRAKVAAFWEAVAFGEMPEMDPVCDAALIARAFPEEIPAKQIDLSGDNWLPGALARREEIKRQIAEMTAEKDQIEADLIAKMEDADRATIGEFSATYRARHYQAQPAKPAIPARVGERVLRVQDHRIKPEEENGQPF